jgi:hypothetical protein
MTVISLVSDVGSTCAASMKQKNALLPSKPLRKTEPCFRSCSQSRHRLNPARSICAHCGRARPPTRAQIPHWRCPPATCTVPSIAAPSRRGRPGTRASARISNLLLFRRVTSVLAHSSLCNSPYLLPFLLSSTALQLPHTSSGV